MILRTALYVLLGFLSLSLAGCGESPRAYVDFSQGVAPQDLQRQEDHIEKPLVIALASVVSPQETIQHYRVIAAVISRKMGRQAVLIQRKTYAEVNQLLANGEADVAFLSTGAYSAYRGMNEIEVLVMAQYGGTSLYHADIIVPKDSPARSLADLQGKVFAFTDPLSYSGHMVIEEVLRPYHTTPETYFSRYFYTYNHDKSLWAVANKLADGASFDSQIYEYMQQRRPELTNQVRLIATIGSAPTGPIVVQKKLEQSQKETLRQVFLELETEPEARKALQGLVTDRFVMPQPELYQPLRKIYDRTSVSL
ncbi:MAG: phosphate/phosphite/phosphonate ABC transporter substrate-binding protein [Sporomusaceae bacterium]|nr:phosphate/phosphite/phosphonate ABC transporter substrate-binding protein [Sporomusaceae bacterium]